MANIEESFAGSRTILWCVPRSASTAFTLCLSGIDDLEIWFEPFCYCFLARVETRRRSGRELPFECRGNEDIFDKALDFMKEMQNGAHFNPEFIS